MEYTGVLVTHVAAGIVAIVTGFTALFLRKGSRLHRLFGRVFVLSMIFTAAGASYLGYTAVEQDMNDVVGGVLTIYLVATGWMAAARKDAETGTFELIAFLVAAAGAATMFYFAVTAIRSGTAFLGGVPALIFGSIVALAAALDLRVVLKGGLSGTQRIARHLWRMCLGMFIAAGSFFLGQMQVLPEPLRKIEIVSIPVIIIILLMIFWLIRVSFTGWYKKA